MTSEQYWSILIGWIVAEIFDLENTPKLLTGPNQHLFDIFCEIQYAITQRGSPRSTCFMSRFESVFRALFSCGIYRGSILARRTANFADPTYQFWLVFAGSPFRIFKKVRIILRPKFTNLNFRLPTIYINRLTRQKPETLGFILWISKTTKTCFWIILTLWSNPYMHNSCLGISPKYLTFRNAPKPIIDLCGISFLCASFETFTIFSAIALKTCTYLPYYYVNSNFHLYIGFSQSWKPTGIYHQWRYYVCMSFPQWYSSFIK